MISSIQWRRIAAKICAGAGTLLLAGVAYAEPGCVGKMWNPVTDLDYRLMGQLKVAGMSFMPAPSHLGQPPKARPPNTCTCKDGFRGTGAGLTVTFWLPSYINDMARQGGCFGFLGGKNLLPTFLNLSSGQEYSTHKQRTEGTTNMQVHWAYADITAIAGKNLFEKCNAVSGGMAIAYMTEIDMMFNNDVYGAILNPAGAVLASNPLLSQMSCGIESVGNTLGGWQDFGVCAWKGARTPLTGNAPSKDSAQVTNMDVTIKYLARSALLGTTMRTIGNDVICKPKFSPLYEPFQHRFQWSYPAKRSARYNVDVLKWGLLGSGGEANASMQNLPIDTSGLSKMDTSTTPASGGGLSNAANIVAAMPKPLNYPTREAGYMQVWEARQCCLLIFTPMTVLQMVASGFLTGPLKELYDLYKTVSLVYEIVTDPIGGILGAIGSGIGSALKSVGSGIASSLGSLVGAAAS